MGIYISSPPTSLLVLLSFLLSIPSYPAFVQDRFVISFWVDPVVPIETFVSAYEMIALSNFTTIMGGFGATVPNEVSAAIDAAAANNLAIIPNICETGPTSPGPSGTCVGLQPPPHAPSGTLMGYQMVDEPQSSDFPALATWVDSVGQRDPGKLRFINLLPNYGFPGPNSTPAYLQYVTDYVTTVQPDILCFDHYPLFGPAGNGNTNGSDDDNGNNDIHSDVSMAGYHRNLQIVSTIAHANNIPFWNFFASMPFNGRPDVTEAQIRWQVYTSLAYGSKGLLYFCYWTPTGTSFIWANAIMTPVIPVGGGGNETYVPGPHYYQATRINSKLKILGGYLFTTTYVGTFMGSGNSTETVPVTLPSGGNIVLTSISGTGMGSTWSICLGIFHGSTQYPSAVLVQNQDVDNPVLITLNPAVNPSLPYEINGYSGLTVMANDDAPVINGWQVYLEAGDARLFVFT